MSATPGQPQAPLAGKSIVVTRPRAQAAELAAAIDAAGGAAVIFPLLEIGPAADGAPLQAILPRLGDFALAVFVSPNAVDYSLPTILAHGGWPKNLLPAAVGKGTARALQRYGVSGTVVPAERFDSEALLELPELQAARLGGRRVVIFRGNGGRELLGDTLEARGATVERIPCYTRRAPENGAAGLIERWQDKSSAAGGIDAFTVSSSEGLRYLVEMLDTAMRQRLAATPVFVPHARIAENAAALGLRRVILTAPADAGIIAGLCAYDWAS